MKLSIVLCTWDRCRQLDGALGALGRLRAPAGVRWEALVVDNGSTDDTEAVLAAHRERLPLRWIRETRRGLSRARNRGVAAADGDWVLFTDDDVRVPRYWLAAYVRAIRRWPRAGYFGGPVEARLRGRPPFWIRSHRALLSPALGAVDHGPRARPLGGGLWPIGGNLAIRRSLLGPEPFSLRLGRRGKRLSGGEEIDLLRCLARQGVTGRWIPEARVAHVPDPERLRPDYLWRWYYGEGRTFVSLQGHRGWRLPVRLFRSLQGMGELGLAAAFLPTPDARWLPHFTRAAALFGVVRGGYR